MWNWLQGSITPPFCKQLLCQYIYPELTFIWRRAYIVKVWHNFTFYALLELDTILSVKLNGIFLWQMLFSNTFVLCVGGLVKSIPGFNKVASESANLLTSSSFCRRAFERVWMYLLKVIIWRALWLKSALIN